MEILDNESYLRLLVSEGFEDFGSEILSEE